MSAQPFEAQVRLEILERSPTAFLALDSDGRCLYINPVGARQLRSTPEALIGALLWELFPQTTGTDSHRANKRAIDDRETVHIEQYWPALDVWFEVTNFPIEIGDRRAIGIHFTDITKRKRQEEQLARSEQTLARAQQLTSVGSWRWHIDTDTVQWSDETFRVLGFPDDDRPGTARMDPFIHPDDRPRDAAAVQNSIETGAPYDQVLRMVPASGGERVCHVLGEVERDSHGRVVSLFGTIQDITDRTRLERVAEQDKRDLRKALRAAQMANYTWDLQTQTIDWSAEYFELTGLDPATFVTSRENVLARIHPDDVARVRADSAAALLAGTGFEVHYRFLHGDGTWREMASVAEADLDSSGRPTRIVGSIRDRTLEVRLEEERLRLERQMQQAQKLESLGVLAGGIAHDFNNLLVGILGNASLAGSDPAVPGSTRELLSEIERAAERAADLTRQLLAYAGKGRFIIEPVALSPLVDEMLTLVRAAMSRKAELHLDLTRDLPAIAADATQLRQIVMNLLTNASDALDDRPGTITLRTGIQVVDDRYRRSVSGGEQLLDGRHVFLQVSDTGIGMDADTLSRIFDPFFTTKFTGRGLGLAATRGIVEGHRGAIQVRSAAGQGTTFTLLFPAIEGPALGRPTAGPSASWRGSGTILVVDDEAPVRRVTRLVLERIGFDVLDAVDGLEALELHRQGDKNIQLTLLDLTMPKLDGEETFRQLLLLDPTARVVLMSGFNAQTVTTQFDGKGLAGFVQKPFRAQELEAAVRAVLGQ